MKTLIQSLKALFFFTLIFGVCYPFIILLVLKAAVPAMAGGSLIIKNGKTVGSTLIGQKFSSPKYFQSRPSAANYDAANSGASNFGPTSARMTERVKADAAEKRKLYGQEKGKALPADMLLTSASGLDPHITFENACLQLKRVAKERKAGEAEVLELVKNNIDGDFLGLWGESGVNVLRLNLALDGRKGNEVH